MRQNKIVSPYDTLIERVAVTLAAEFYEIGRKQGLTSIHKNARSYARANLEKFIPKSVDILIDMLGNPSCPIEQKDMIHDALIARANDPEAITVTDINNEILNTLDIKKVIGNPDPLAQLLKPKRPDPITVLTNTTKMN